MTFRFLILLTAFFSRLPAMGEGDSKPARHARFLALGDLPPFRQEIRDGVSYELDPPPGSIPPRQVIPGFGEESAKALPLRIGFITPPVKVPEGEGTLTLRRAEDKPDAAPWLEVKRPEDGDFLVLLFRATGKATWDEASFIVVPDGAASPAGSVRITNLFPQSVRVVWGAEGIMLPAGKSVLRTVASGAELPFQIVIPDASGSMKAYFSGTVTQNQGERGFVTIYRADGEKPRRPLKVSMLREPVVEPPKEEKKK